MSITDALIRDRDALVSSAVRHLNALVRKHGRHNVDGYHAASAVYQFDFVVTGRQEAVDDPGRPGGRAAVRLLTTNGDGVTVFAVPRDREGSVNVRGIRVVAQRPDRTRPGGRGGRRFAAVGVGTGHADRGTQRTWVRQSPRPWSTAWTTTSRP